MAEKPAKSLSLKQLELFLALAGADNIASAGARLGMTPSATSHALRTLEATLGGALLDRNATGTQLSYAGEHILPYVRDVFASLHSIRATMGSCADLRSGSLTVGSQGASSSLNLLPPLLTLFKRRYPGVDVCVAEQPDGDLARAIAERKIEIGVVSLPKPELDTLPMATDELMAVLPEHHPLAEKETLGVTDLANHPLIVLRAGTELLITKIFKRAGVKPWIAHELSQIMSIVEYVRRGQGISVLASLVLPERYEGLVYRKIRPVLKRRLGLACLDERRLSPAAHAFWKLARTAAPHHGGTSKPR